MQLETRKERLRQVVRKTLDAAGLRRPLTGPWAAFLDERSGWDDARPLNRGLYRELYGQFDNNTLREVLLAEADAKISRTCVDAEKLGVLGVAAERYGFHVVAGNSWWILRADRGKGGWANGAERMAERGEPGAVCNVYIASDGSLAETGKMLEEAGEDDLFGALLGIPACCREAFDRCKNRAAEKQCDFVPYVMENSGGRMPYDWRLNYIAQYFGYSLLSFFPCSFQCEAAAAVAERTFALLANCDAEWAKRFAELQQSNVLYTEKRGLHLFRARLREVWIEYGPQDLISTEDTDLARLLRQGDRLQVSGKHEVEVYRALEKLARIDAGEACMCCFYS